ncbi:MAG TPA: peptidase [Bacteroidales bacterium]|nr:peptidase [Bacteroidales bacterium]
MNNTSTSQTNNILKKRIIGRSDKIDFPMLKLKEIDVKIDTGAYTSSIHCVNFEKKKLKGKIVLKCNFLDPEHSLYHGKEFVFEEFSTTTVKSSNGVAEERYKIKTEIKIFGKKYPILLTLAERTDMRFPVLLGRNFLKKKFIVDVSRTCLSYKRKKRILLKKHITK